MPKRLTNLPRKGIYHYSTTNFNGTYNHYTSPVTIVAETDKSYKIQLSQPIMGWRRGDTTWVRKHKVEVEREQPDVSEMWYTNM